MLAQTLATRDHSCHRQSVSMNSVSSPVQGQPEEFKKKMNISTKSIHNSFINYRKNRLKNQENINNNFINCMKDPEILYLLNSITLY